MSGTVTFLFAVNVPVSFIYKFLPLVENIGRKFSTSQQASGVMTIMDIMQEGNLSLIKAVRKIDWEKFKDKEGNYKTQEDILKTLKSFLSKRIKGGIRRGIDTNRGDMRIPEHKLNEIRRKSKDEKMVAMFFNSMFLSIDDKVNKYLQDHNLEIFIENSFVAVLGVDEYEVIKSLNLFPFNSLMTFFALKLFLSFLLRIISVLTVINF